MTQDDVNEMRPQQRLEEAERNGDIEGIEHEKETMRWLEDRLREKGDDEVIEEF